MKNLLLIVLICFSTVVFSQDKAAEKADAYFKKGIELIEKGKFYRATAKLTKAIELNHKIDTAYCMRGYAYYLLDNYNIRTIEDYQNEKELYAWLDLNKIAMRNYLAAITVNPKYYVAYRYRGNLYYKQSNFEKAMEDYQKAIELNPKDYDAYSNIGAVYHSQLNFERAIEEYSKAIELNPNNYKPYNNKGYVYYLQSNYHKAIENYTKAIELNTENDEDKAYTYLARGNAYNIQSKYHKAIEDYTKSIELSPDSHKKFKTFSIETYTNRADIYIKLSEIAQTESEKLNYKKLEKADRKKEQMIENRDSRRLRREEFWEWFDNTWWGRHTTDEDYL